MIESARQLFLDRLQRGLRGLSRDTIEEAVAEYAAHFDAGREAGRSEAEIAQALGDPDRLARELRAEVGVRRWEDTRSPGSAFSAIFGVIGLATVDLFIVLPVLLIVGSIASAFLLAGVVLCLVGSLLLPFAIVDFSPFSDLDWLQSILVALGLASGGASMTACCLLVFIGCVSFLVRFGRAHYRVVSPAARL
ncbi:DUF1700 domain-containing protein (plasmid) [Kozakia baliensis]|uniref:DUF1700 domain-containing protein n=1 Tax=Kozakia baliensis TaxID=153496 RepID=UPI00345BDA1D